jgi:hypothetical protein
LQIFFYILIIFYIIISGNFLAELFSCGTQRLFNNSFVKHILGFITLYVFVVYVSPGNISELSPIRQFGITIAIYIWFVITTRVDKRYFIIVLACFVSIVVIDMQVQYYTKNEDQYPMGTSTAQDKEQYFSIMRNIQLSIGILSIIVTLFGFGVYTSKKKIEYGSGFTWFKYFRGNPTCKDQNPIYDKSDLQYFKQLFTS